jgi:hypothetical protein
MDEPAGPGVKENKFARTNTLRGGARKPQGDVRLDGTATPRVVAAESGIVSIPVLFFFLFLLVVSAARGQGTRRANTTWNRRTHRGAACV